MLLSEAFIIFTAFLFLKPLEPTNLFALSTVVLSFAFLLNYCLIFDLFDLVSMKSSSSTSQLGALMWGSKLYLIIALGAIVCSYSFEWELSVAIWAQCGALLPLILSIIFSMMSVNAVSSAEQQHTERKESLKEISDRLFTMELEIKCDPSKSGRTQQIDQIKEQIRYITYSSAPKAKEIERQILNTIIEMTHIPSSTPQDAGEWSTAVEKCFTLIALRKKQF